MSAVTDEILEKLQSLTLLEAAELVKQIEDTFGVSAAAPVGGMVMAAPGAAGAAWCGAVQTGWPRKTAQHYTKRYSSSLWERQHPKKRTLWEVMQHSSKLSLSSTPHIYGIWTYRRYPLQPLCQRRAGRWHCQPGKSRTDRLSTGDYHSR